ncbi:MAG: hypothetical protein LBN95_00790 [Prevotellaceae bacterium]|jgi:hypothetical protein|nr:hypothetical protein [Prevotellaceae bacterium]
MKKILFFTLCSVALIGFTGCKKVQKENTFIGKWTVAAIYVDDIKINVLPFAELYENGCFRGASLEFFSDLTFDLQCNCNWLRAAGNYTFENDLITAVDTLKDGFTQIFTFYDGFLRKEMDNGGHHWKLNFKKLEEKSRYDVQINLWNTDYNSINDLKPASFNLLQSVENGGTITITAPEIEGYVVDTTISTKAVTFDDVHSDNTVDFVYKTAVGDQITEQFLSGTWKVKFIFSGGIDFTQQATMLFPCLTATSIIFSTSPQTCDLISTCEQLPQQTAAYAIDDFRVTINFAEPLGAVTAERYGELLYLNVPYETMTLQLQLEKE